ncbi:MAG: diacylglycerol kinase family protein [Terriglobales bacterium]|jgi:diacylglycerol kinase (ATP)
MRAAAIFGPGASEKSLRPFQITKTTWLTGIPTRASEVDAILIFGGDGTVHRHLPDLVRLQLPVLVVPCGSGNDFARALGLGSASHALAAWQRFLSADNNLRAIDLGVITLLSDPSTSYYFCCVGGVGLDAEVARRANRLPRWLRAHGGYVLTLAPSLFRLAPFPMKISLPFTDTSDAFVPHSNQPTVLAAFANAPTYGSGMKIAPHAQLDDGKLDLCIISDIDPFKLFCLFPTIYFGKHLSMREVDYLQTSRLRIETEQPLGVYADGEYVCKTPIEARVARAALRVITP